MKPVSTVGYFISLFGNTFEKNELCIQAWTIGSATNLSLRLYKLKYKVSHVTNEEIKSYQQTKQMK